MKKLWLVVALAAIGGEVAAAEVVISFEQGQGFPAAGGKFTDAGTPEGVVAKWTNESSAPNYWGTHVSTSKSTPKPISGMQVGSFGFGGHGITVGAMHLGTSAGTANYSLKRFHWGYRGNGNSRPGGNAYLELEYFNLRGKSIGKERFQGGLDDEWLAKFTPAKTNVPAGTGLSKVIFRGVPPNSMNGSGSFFLDDVVLLELKPKQMLTLVKGGRTTATIVTPANPGKWTNEAVKWLQEYVQKATGAKLSAITEEMAVPSGALISVGQTRMAARDGIDSSGLKYDGCKLIVKDNVLYLLGLDGPELNVQAVPGDGSSSQTCDWVGARGTCRAVIKFLEDFCGVRWFLPGPQGELVPQSENIFVPQDLDEIFQPAFAYNGNRSPYDENVLGEPGKAIAALANNYRKAVTVAAGGHTYYAAVSQQKYGKAHPEYYALIGGERRNAEWTRESPYGHHLCSSNSDVKRLLVEHVRDQLDGGLDWKSIGQEDGYRRCQCPECEKLDNYRGFPTGMRWEEFQRTKLRDNPPERLFLLHKAVIDEVAKSHPDKMVMLMCYAPTAWPSKKINYFGDNVIGELMHMDPEYIEAWSGKVAGLAGFSVWFNTQCQMGLNLHMTAGETAERVQYLHEKGFVGLGLDPEAIWGLQGRVFYMAGRLMGDPSEDYKAIIEEYCNGVYGKASGTMTQFFDVLEARLRDVVPIDKNDISASGRNTRLPRWMNTPNLFLAQYPPAFLEQLEALIQKAEKEADTERTQGWVRLSRDQFDFIKLLTEMLIAYRTWQTKETPENWQELKAGVDAFEAYRLKIVTYPKAYTDVWWPGHGAFCKWLVGNLEDTGLAFYTTWDTRKKVVMKKGIRGMAMGYGTSFIKEPLTLNFDTEN